MGLPIGFLCARSATGTILSACASLTRSAYKQSETYRIGDEVNVQWQFQHSVYIEWRLSTRFFFLLYSTRESTTIRLVHEIVSWESTSSSLCYPKMFAKRRISWPIAKYVNKCAAVVAKSEATQHSFRFVQMKSHKIRVLFLFFYLLQNFEF